MNVTIYKGMLQRVRKCYSCLVNAAAILGMLEQPNYSVVTILAQIAITFLRAEVTPSRIVLLQLVLTLR